MSLQPPEESFATAEATAMPKAEASWAAVTAIGVGAFALVTTEFLPVGLLPQIAHDICSVSPYSC